MTASPPPTPPSRPTVWLARDLSNRRYVAMKILVSDISASTNEVQILRQINDVAPVQGARHVTQLLDEFEHSGPNSIYKCLVFELMGPSINSIVEELLQFNPRKQ
ncbi:Serine/threonine-protein kinase SKY1 like [Verticillium longisporum]|uniref:non-specific serine/threonine protein kinase n=1 Tax=Verticillium longisporum TaxID=100787 RepID=A0A8I3A024_VERLO|nr:Serine/threonine-protein kinase SKY1 like [Verticillium longisporum]KAG7148859.1 Serine/threonine-protein kinase SKY1 like [Verticillium longisporum]